MKLQTSLKLPKINKPKLITVTSIMVLIIAASIIWFGISYQKLNDSIQAERIESMNQIGEIILEKIQIISDSYSDELEQVADILMRSNAETVEDVSQIINNSSDICLLTTSGKCFDVKGNVIHILDTQGIYANLKLGEVNSTFSSIRTKGDYWIFSVGVENITIDGDSVVGILKLIDDSKYSTITTEAIFGNQGASYVVNSNGVVLFKPNIPATNQLFQGYNMISYLESQNVSSKQVALFEDALLNNTNGQIVADISGVTWLIQTIPDYVDRNIVLTVPISVTAKETFDSMQNTIFSIIIAIISAVTLFIVWFISFNHRNNLMKLQQAKANSKSDFMSKISHDMRTPLNAIVGMIEIAKKVQDDNEALIKCLDGVKSSSEYLVSIINDVLDMSRIENGKMVIDKKPFDLKELLKTIAKIEAIPAELRNITLNFEDNLQNGYLHIGDSVRINQCLINLISNAIKFTPEGGTITIQCFETSLENSMKMVKFIVKDTGIGMSKEFMTKIFEPFEQERTHSSMGNAGSGLGLSIVYYLSHLMGGEISVESEQNVGSCFTLEIPMRVIEDQNEKIVHVIEASVEMLKGKRVLLAEDNAVNREIVSYFLDDLGLKIDEAENGKIAVDKFLESQEGYYDFILMDIQMPVIDGLEATRRIRLSNHPDARYIPIFALSANAFKEDVDKSLEAGMQSHMSKPIDSIALKQTLLEYCEYKKNMKSKEKE